MQSPVIFWFRNDLRLHDNPALSRAIETGKPVVLVFIFDEKWFVENPLGFPSMGEFRKQFLTDTLFQLQKKIANAGSHLLVFTGNVNEILAKLYSQINASAIYATKEYAHDEILAESELKKKVALKLFSGNMLFPPESLPFLPETSPFYYTRFKNRVWELGHSVSQVENIIKIPSINTILNKELEKKLTELPVSDNNLRFTGGEDAAMAHYYSWITADGLNRYLETRNQLIGSHFSSHLAPWLSNGSLSVRWLWHKIHAYAKEHSVNEESLVTFCEQLIWREYYRYIMMRYGNKLFWTKGLRQSEHGMFDDIETFNHWKNGITGQPIVDALMRELLHTGFMSNRGRMLVSYYLAKELKVNWQWGAAWFENRLIDYEVYNNYGNWAYQSGRGTDSRVNRRFNLQKQAEKFDPDGTFRKKWLG
ncbi:DASH family cryptochrome [Alkalitalea saponilacus]|uniref:Cryptochrome DASH n=1 Tax=Alkalitalea saponilacus TaxID=889453 RepID=A0A1T5HTZ9_9BACT|nr:DASH family cryptochrome [Alkalitalea saponilacus]ASB50250.1 deoxyribodipyrimidine photolyase [Alkalitalea saponilacus]SKC24112.1 deoxyribodipyrimidine photo-lyase [Alkalitalea saponilacus]